MSSELPGQGVRKRVLNSRARSDSSPEHLFRAPEAILPGSGRADFIEGDVDLIGSDAEVDAEMLEVRGKKRPPVDPQIYNIGTASCSKTAV